MNIHTSKVSSILLALSPALVAATPPPVGSEEPARIPWWFWWLFVLAVALPILWWLNGRIEEHKGEHEGREGEHEGHEGEHEGHERREGREGEHEGHERREGREGEQEEAPPVPAFAVAATPEEEPEEVEGVEEPEPEQAAPAPVPDDLKRIEGIGPKISGLLQESGIVTFSQLADTDVARLEEIVRGAGIRIADPTTWPEQAALAAEDKWEELDALQDRLKGGRRV